MPQNDCSSPQEDLGDVRQLKLANPVVVRWIALRQWSGAGIDVARSIPEFLVFRPFIAMMPHPHELNPVLMKMMAAARQTVPAM